MLKEHGGWANFTSLNKKCFHNRRTVGVPHQKNLEPARLLQTLAIAFANCVYRLTDRRAADPRQLPEILCSDGCFLATSSYMAIGHVS